MAYMEKEAKKEWIYVYYNWFTSTVHLKLTQHCKSTIIQHKFFLNFKWLEHVNNTLKNEDIWMVDKNKKSCPLSFVIRVMKIKTKKLSLNA